jgi:hypothetical protein
MYRPLTYLVPPHHELLAICSDFLTPDADFSTSTAGGICAAVVHVSQIFLQPPHRSVHRRRQL